MVEPVPSSALRIDVFTIFPGMVEHFAGQSLVGRARAAGRLDIRVHDLRSCATDVHRSVDDAPFGGGAGMVLMPEPIFAAVEKVEPPRPLLYLGPAGRRFDQDVARELAGAEPRGFRPAASLPHVGTHRGAPTVERLDAALTKFLEEVRLVA